MDLGRGGDVVRVRVRLHPQIRHSTAELALREILATPCRSGYGYMSSSIFFGQGLVPTTDSPDPGPPEFPLATSNTSRFGREGCRLGT
jgi:hypothetical protein